LLDRASYHYFSNPLHETILGGTKNTITTSSKTQHGWTDRVFADIGSGTGRLVIAAAALHPEWKLCKGIELLPGIHNMAMQKLSKCGEESLANGFKGILPSNQDNEESTFQGLPMSPITLSCGSFEDDVRKPLGDVDVAFTFSSCYPKHTMIQLSQAVCKQVRF